MEMVFFLLNVPIMPSSTWHKKLLVSCRKNIAASPVYSHYLFWILPITYSWIIPIASWTVFFSKFWFIVSAWCNDSTSFWQYNPRMSERYLADWITLSIKKSDHFFLNQPKNSRHNEFHFSCKETSFSSKSYLLNTFARQTRKSHLLDILLYLVICWI